jgi:hypothetical protein
MRTGLYIFIARSVGGKSNSIGMVRAANACARCAFRACLARACLGSAARQTACAWRVGIDNRRASGNRAKMVSETSAVKISGYRNISNRRNNQRKSA